MRFRKFKRLLWRLFDRSHNHIQLGEGSVCDIPSEASVTETTIRINGSSRLIIEAGARITNCSIQIDSGSTVTIGAGSVLNDVDICVWKQSFLTFGKDCQINSFSFVIQKGRAVISDHNVFSNVSGTGRIPVKVEDGSLSIGDYNRLQNSMWVRFGGRLIIGRYNCINNATDIRCDESIRIGSYNMISYRCDIWDTNTHSFYSLEEKKELFPKDFPAIGKERTKPDTKPVSMGDGNWVGKYSCILKGSVLGNEVIVATHSIVSNVTVGDGQKVIPARSEIRS